MNERLQKLIDQAKCNTHYVMVGETLHLCAHGTGEIILWSINPETQSGFNLQVEEFDGFSSEQYDSIRKLMVKCNELWREEHLRLSKDSKPLEWEKSLGGWVSGKLSISEEDNGVSYTASYGPDNEWSHSGFMPACSIDDAKQIMSYKFKTL